MYYPFTKLHWLVVVEGYCILLLLLLSKLVDGQAKSSGGSRIPKGRQAGHLGYARQSANRLTASTTFPKPTSSPALGSKKSYHRPTLHSFEPFSHVRPFVHRLSPIPSEETKRANRVGYARVIGIQGNVGIALEGSRRTQEGFLGLKVCPYLREEVRRLLGCFLVGLSILINLFISEEIQRPGSNSRAIRICDSANFCRVTPKSKLWVLAYSFTIPSKSYPSSQGKIGLLIDQSFRQLVNDLTGG